MNGSLLSRGPSSGVLRRGSLSVRVSWPSILLGGALTGLAAAVTVLSLTVGDFTVGAGEVVEALTGRAGTMVTHVVVEMRLPRVLTATGVGAALALSGSLLQRLARNPLVSPDIIGVSAGATTAAVLAIVVFGGTTLTVTVGSLVGAVCAVSLLYLLSYRRGVVGNRMILVGIALSAMAGSVTSYLLTRTELSSAQRAMVWITGSLANREWPHAITIWAALALLAPVAFMLSRSLALLQLGDDMATALGSRVQVARAALVFTSAALAAMAASVAGPVSFVALVAPQIVRRLLGAGPAGLFPTMVCGAVLVACSDLIARTAFGGAELPVGVITGILGAPYLLYLLTRGNRAGRGG
ncbi:FecCD family ABC transporter permease [Nocardiopsis alba]|uniref:FecCD family ABC transporter permease n=1 Tax=Nocardiopsis alba TaxID=53437 RepID=UPI00366D4323